MYLSLFSTTYERNYDLHVALTRALAAPVGRMLFRREGPTVLVQTEEQPAFRAQRGLHLVQTKAVTYRPQAGHRLRFRLLAEPAERRGDRVVRRLLTPEGARGWLEGRAQTRGFRLLAAEVALAEPVRGKEGGFRPVLYEGVLEVTDPEAFLRAWARGIGKGKYVGLGMLTLAPAAAGPAGADPLPGPASPARPGAA